MKTTASQTSSSPARRRPARSTPTPDTTASHTTAARQRHAHKDEIRTAAAILDEHKTYVAARRAAAVCESELVKLALEHSRTGLAQFATEAEAACEAEPSLCSDCDYQDLNRGQREVLDAVIEATTEWHVDALADLISEAEDEDEVERILAADLNDLGWDHDADIADTQAEIDSLVDDEEDGNED